MDTFNAAPIIACGVIATALVVLLLLKILDLFDK